MSVSVFSEMEPSSNSLSLQNNFKNCLSIKLKQDSFSLLSETVVCEGVAFQLMKRIQSHSLLFVTSDVPSPLSSLTPLQSLSHFRELLWPQTNYFHLQ